MFLDGSMYSFGIVLKEIKDHFGVTQDVVNLVQSLNVGFLFLSGEFFTKFHLNKYHRYIN
jgi:hypothetical protein